MKTQKTASGSRMNSRNRTRTSCRRALFIAEVSPGESYEHVFKTRGMGTQFR